MKTKAVLILLCGAVVSCIPPTVVTTPKVEQEKVINYDFTPPNQNSEKVDIAFILLNPKLAEVFDGARQPMFTKFINNMGADYEEMLIAKGYSMRGPYDDYQEIVFSDKIETDLMLETDINFTYEWGSGAVKYKENAGFGNYTPTTYTYYINGDLHLGGKINLVIKEALTKEKLWVKSIALVGKAIPVQSNTYKVRSHEEGVNKLMADVNYRNAVYEALDDYYQKALMTAWNHLEPQELLALKKQVKVLREKKGY